MGNALSDAMNDDLKPPRLPPPVKLRPLRWFSGIIVSNLFTALVFGGLTWLSRSADPGLSKTAQLIGMPSMFLVPLLCGVVAAFCWRRLDPGIGALAVGALLVTMVGLAGAALMMGEGVICLLIVSPLYCAVVFGGALLGRIWFRHDPAKFRLSILPLLVVVTGGEMLTRADRTGVVVDEILIQASPAKVWPELTSFPAIDTPPSYWMFRIGLPYPESTTTEGDFVGAGRQCIFSGGMVFQEKVAVCRPREDLTFDITGLPQHPELIGHITPGRGQFLLRDNGDGTTTLTGSTWYTLHVRPLWYFDWWTEQIFRAVHLRVMEDVRRRAEAK